MKKLLVVILPCGLLAACDNPERDRAFDNLMEDLYAPSPQADYTDPPLDLTVCAPVEGMILCRGSN